MKICMRLMLISILCFLTPVQGMKKDVFKKGSKHLGKHIKGTNFPKGQWGKVIPEYSHGEQINLRPMKKNKNLVPLRPTDYTGEVVYEHMVEPQKKGKTLVQTFNPITGEAETLVMQRKNVNQKKQPQGFFAKARQYFGYEKGSGQTRGYATMSGPRTNEQFLRNNVKRTQRDLKKLNLDLKGMELRDKEATLLTRMKDLKRTTDYENDINLKNQVQEYQAELGKIYKENPDIFADYELGDELANLPVEQKSYVPSPLTDYTGEVVYEYEEPRQREQVQPQRFDWRGEPVIEEEPFIQIEQEGKTPTEVIKKDTGTTWAGRLFGWGKKETPSEMQKQGKTQREKELLTAQYYTNQQGGEVIPRYEGGEPVNLSSNPKKPSTPGRLTDYTGEVVYEYEEPELTGELVRPQTFDSVTGEAIAEPLMQFNRGGKSLKVPRNKKNTGVSKRGYATNRKLIEEVLQENRVKEKLPAARNRQMERTLREQAQQGLRYEGGEPLNLPSIKKQYKTSPLTDYTGENIYEYEEPQPQEPVEPQTFNSMGEVDFPRGEDELPGRRVVGEQTNENQEFLNRDVNEAQQELNAQEPAIKEYQESEEGKANTSDYYDIDPLGENSMETPKQKRSWYDPRRYFGNK